MAIIAQEESMNKKIYMKSYLLILILAITVASCGSNGSGGSETSENTYAVGGTVSGLTGTGLVLQNNGTDDLTITANGAFTFTTKIANSAAYAVTVRTQPSNPAQTCTVTNGSGTVSGANITNVAVN